MKNIAILPLLAFGLVLVLSPAFVRAESKTLVLEPPSGVASKHIVLVAGDEEYRSEETMPMLAKILSQKHSFKCTVVFAWSKDGSFVDPNNQAGLQGLAALDSADLMIIGTRFRKPVASEAAHITSFIDAGKPVIGIRTATHAFNGSSKFGDEIDLGKWGLRILGEQWVNHHGKHKSEGARSVVENSHPILNSVGEIFAPSDVYGVIHLTDADNILLRAAVTKTLDPKSPNLGGDRNDPMQPFAWLHQYTSPNGTKGQSFCTTGGASVDFVDEDLRRMIVNAAFHLTGLEVPQRADVDFVDPFYPSFFGFIRDKSWWKEADMQVGDYALGQSPARPDPVGSPEWNHRPMKPGFDNSPPQKADAAKKPAAKQKDAAGVSLSKRLRIAAVGNSLAERMNLFGYFETLLHTRHPDKELVFRNFGWPADEVANQQRPGSYTKIDDPLEVFAPQMMMCFFGYNESFAGREESQIQAFVDDYRSYIAETTQRFTAEGKKPSFVLISPIAFESTGNPLHPSGDEENKNLKAYSDAIAKLAAEGGYPFVDLFSPTAKIFSAQSGNQFTANGAHLNERGDRAVSQLVDAALFSSKHPTGINNSTFEEVRSWVNDKSWFHAQDYRMLNGWYVYGGRRTWDTETFPTEYRKIRNMVAVRDQYIWDMAAGRQVGAEPDDSSTGEVFEPETMFGTRSDNFREMREPVEMKYTTPEESIATMKVPEGMEVKLFASEREFPELANPNQIAFDNRGRLWVSCMTNYPQWQPGSAKPDDKLLILEDTDGDGKADVCKTFYDKLICPTGFEFWNGGVLVVDEPRILFIKDTDGDDQADLVQQIVDGIATDDTHHTMGAWEFSHGGQLHMLEGISLSTTLETPWGPFRNKNTGGGYVFDPHSQSFTHYRTPGYGNPWCLVFDQWGNGIVGDGTNAKQHWVSPLAGKEVDARKTLTPVFDNEGMRPAVGNEFLLSRHLPDDMQGQFIYACVINMHGMPRFNLRDEKEGAGFVGERIDDLLSSTDMVFRPVDPKVGPDGAIWFGDWCNALIGHMQYSQRDPNRDHEHGRVYRLVNTKKPLLEPLTQADKSIPELLDQLNVYELRTRYRVRRELRDRPKAGVYAALNKWIAANNDPRQLCEAMWIQESFRDVDESLLDRVLASEDFHARAAAVHTITNERDRVADFKGRIAAAMADANPRVRLEAVRGASFIEGADGVEIALKAVDQTMDYWIDYTLEHTLHALQPYWQGDKPAEQLANSTDAAKKHLTRHIRMSGPGGAAVKPLEVAENVDAPMPVRKKAISALANIRGGKADRGAGVFKQVCSACHMVGDIGKKFGPDLSDIASRMNRHQIITTVLLPNDEIAKGYESVSVVDEDGQANTGFILKETDDVLSLGIANGKQVDIDKDTIEIRKPMKASSMPEGLITQIAPIEFLDLIAYLEQQRDLRKKVRKGWVSIESRKEPKLRTHDGMNEISRDASIRLGRTMKNSEWNRDAYLFLSDAPSNDWGFVFHSDHDVDRPAITIRLKDESEIGHLYLQNRLSKQFYDRAKGLAVWTSVDGESYTQVWKAKKPQAEYQIDLPPGTKAKYIKIGLDGKGTFHLNRGVVFGR
ncbi:PVC-type heme-binding CxxCH protein [Planctomycetes bacterium K23_9]